MPIRVSLFWVISRILRKDFQFSRLEVGQVPICFGQSEGVTALNFAAFTGFGLGVKFFSVCGRLQVNFPTVADLYADFGFRMSIIKMRDCFGNCEKAMD